MTNKVYKQKYFSFITKNSNWEGWAYNTPMHTIARISLSWQGTYFECFVMINPMHAELI